MKPKIFLSHSKTDKELIEKLASDLRAARIDVWYDEWEIPVGDSFRRQITKGIEESDLFFVYLTPNSAGSHWVQHELDTAFIKQINEKRNILALFVDQGETRKLLPLDLQSFHSPVLNESDYYRPLTQLISKAWESFLERKTSNQQQMHRLQVLELQNEIKGLRLEYAQSTKSGIDRNKTIDRLSQITFKVKDREYSLLDILMMLANALATSSNMAYVGHLLVTGFGVKKEGSLSFNELYEETNYRVSDFMGPLIIQGIVEHLPSHGEYDDSYRLTEEGKRIAVEISK